MGTYRVNISSSINKDLRELSKFEVGKIMGHITALKTDPAPPQAVLISPAEHLYRIRVGQARVIYAVDEEQRTVTVHYVHCK